VAAAAYHMMISAHLRGFSSIWNAGIGPHAPLREMLDLPPIFELQGAIALGRARADAPRVKAPRRPLDDVLSFGRFIRPAMTIYPARPDAAYPFYEISKARNPWAEWSPEAWRWDQLADFRGYSVWAKSPLAGVFLSRRQGEATDRELDLLPPLPPAARVVEIMGWGGTSTTALRARLAPDATLDVVELGQQNLDFIRERLAQEGLGHLPTDYRLMQDGRLPHADRSLDLVVVPQTLEHMPDKAGILSEIRRVLRPDGALVLSARNMTSRAGRQWCAVESRGGIPLQGPFTPLLARQLRDLLAPGFVVEAEVGIGLGTDGDADVTEGLMRLRRRVIALRARPRP
jgi:SAM-dependent methyltransferase